MTNRSWNRRERLLALDLYLRHGQLSKRDPKVIELSDALRAIALLDGETIADDFRNPAGVALKLANFAALDPAHAGAGMSRYAGGDLAAWSEFAGDTDRLADALESLGGRTLVKGEGPSPLLPLEDAETEEYSWTVDAAVRVARRREAGMVRDFGEYLRFQGHEVGSRHHIVDGTRLRIDLVDATTGAVWEAKSEVGRNAVRLAIGQLFDYVRLDSSYVGRGVLLPRRPAPGLIDLCHSVDTAVAFLNAPQSYTILDPS